mmetsp:Transcript_19321/g.21603  ORF Transcript_19321/g.21603 Transcript_19321/m.21603 type:complete len:597 (-) Transcript_19321:95-1885(-)
MATAPESAWNNATTTIAAVSGTFVTGSQKNNRNNNNNNNNHMDTDFFEQMVSDLKDRFDSDVALMWQTSPSEWGDTTWKDFTIMGGIVAGLVASILCCCCFCCRGGGSGRGRDVKTLLENKRARGKHRQKQERRSRYFNRSRSEETGDSHSDYTGSYSGHNNNNSTDDWEAPFVLIEDVESKDDTFSKTAGGSKSTTAAHIASTPTSPVYAKRNESLEDGGSTSYAALSPLSSGSKTEPGTSDDIESLGNRTSSSLPIVSNVATQKNGTTTSRTLTKKSSPALQESSGGIVGETVDVWSEFLGLKKTKYNIQADHLDEDSQVDETDDEKGGDRRRKRNKSSMKSTKIKSPKSDLTNTSQNMLSSLHTRSIHVGSVSTVSESAPTTGSAGAGATAIASDTAVDNNDPGGSVADSATAAGTIVSSATNGTTGTNTNNNTNKGSSASSVAETPITSNAKSSKGTRSPRKGFLKSKKNLRIFGGNKSKNNNNNSNNNNNNNDNDTSRSRKANRKTKKKHHKNNSRKQRNSNTVEVDTSSLYWTRLLRTVIDASWSREISQRPSALQFKAQLQVEYTRLSLHSCSTPLHSCTDSCTVQLTT